jgi:hypothetical protein
MTRKATFRGRGRGRGRGRENPAGPAFAQALTMARVAGAKIGDTSGFEPWLVKAHLDGRGPQVIARLRTEFWQGVETGWPASAMAPAAKGIWKDKEGWRVASDPDSLFDSLLDAQRFVGAQRQHNPAQPWWERSNPGGYTSLLPPMPWPDWMDDNEKRFLEAVWRAGARTDQQNVRSISASKVKAAMHRYFVSNVKTYDDTSLPFWLSPLMSDPGTFSIIKIGEAPRIGRVA